MRSIPRSGRCSRAEFQFSWIELPIAECLDLPTASRSVFDRDVTRQGPGAAKRNGFPLSVNGSIERLSSTHTASHHFSGRKPLGGGAEDHPNAGICCKKGSECWNIFASSFGVS